MVELVNIARYQSIEDHYHGQGQGERHDCVEGIVGICPGFPITVQVTANRIGCRKQEYRTAYQNR